MMIMNRFNIFYYHVWLDIVDYLIILAMVLTNES